MRGRGREREVPVQLKCFESKDIKNGYEDIRPLALKEDVRSEAKGREVLTCDRKVELMKAIK
jgi:hypothetical protein